MRPRLLLVLVFVLGWASGGAADLPRPVAFQTDDGVTISADFCEIGRGDSPAGFVILLHDFGADRKSMVPLLESFARQGIAALAVDLRGHGESATPELRNRVKDRDPLLFDEFQRDVRAAYDWLAARATLDRARFGVVGAGVGGSLALRYAALDRSVDTVIAIGPPAAPPRGLDTASDMAKIKGRQMLLLCDTAVPEQRAAAEKLAKLTSGVVCENFARPADSAPFGDPGIVKRIVEHVQSALGKPSSEVVYGTINNPIYHQSGSGWISKIGATNLRAYSSPREAEARGVRKSRSNGPEDSAASQPARRSGGDRPRSGRKTIP